MIVKNFLERKIYKVAEINAEARLILAANFSDIWIEGEISNFTVPSSGHFYFSLKDTNAQVRCAMFRNYNFTLNFKPKNGDHVIVRAEVSLYEARGDYQLIVQTMELAGDGILHEKFLRLKNKLEAEGLFTAASKKPTPKLPQTIGVITSPSGAAIRDILSVLQRRFPPVNVIIYPTSVQGEAAAQQIASAINIANQRHECEVLILTRGGGSLEDLWPFNEECVARAIFASDIPLISAVGHEIDFTIADFVADVRAPTPSIAAEFAVPNMLDWLAKVEHLYQRSKMSMQYKLEQTKLNFALIKNRLRHPKDYLLQQMQKADELERRLHTAMQLFLKSLQHKFSNLSSALDLVSPLATLQRGFAIVTKNEKIITQASAVNCGDTIKAQLAEGVLECEVKNK